MRRFFVDSSHLLRRNVIAAAFLAGFVVCMLSMIGMALGTSRDDL